MGLDRCGAGWNGLTGHGHGRAVVVAGLIDRLAGLDFATENRAVLDGQALGLNLACDLSSAPELNALATRDLAFQASAHNDFAGDDVSFHGAIGAYRQAAIGQVELAFDWAIDKEIFTAGDFTLDANPLADAGNGV
jgi:hypothetical protein